MSQLKPVCAAYVPPPSFPGATAFYENIKRFRTAFPLVLFSDYDYGSDVLRLKTTPEIVKAAQYPNGVKNMFSISNLLFFTALGMVNNREFTHMIYVEADCRVGCHEWDRCVMAEREKQIVERKLTECFVAGSIVGYSTSNAGLEFCRAWNRFVRDHHSAQFPVPSYGGNGAAESHEPAVFANGALGVYDLKFLKEVFGEVVSGVTDTAKLAGMVTAWDYYQGRHLYRNYKEKMFEKVVHLDSVYSGYGDGFTTYEQRQQWLLSGTIVAVHQIKTAWPGPMEPVHGNLVEEASEDCNCPPKTCYKEDLDPGVMCRGELSLTAPETLTSPIEPKLIVASDEPKAPTPDAGAVTIPNSNIAKPLPPNMDVVRAQEKAGEPLTPLEKALVDKPLTPVKSSRPRPFKFRVDILIVTHAKDAKWLAVALKSIGKFCRGFGEVVIVYPEGDESSIQPVVDNALAYHVDVRTVLFNQAEGKGHLHHMVQKCMADIHCPDADLVLHTDSDCVFFKPTTPQDYFHSGKPIVLMTPYEIIKDTHRGHYQWKHVTEQVFKEPVHYSTMESHPSTWWREHYPMLRSFIELKQGMKFADYVLSGSPVFPYTFCEFVSLGAFALRSKELVDKYHFINLSRQPRPDDHLIQFWSHSGLDEPQEAPARLPAKYPIAADGKIIPREIIENILQPTSA